MNEDPFPTVNRRPVPSESVVNINKDVVLLDQFYLLDGAPWERHGQALVGYKTKSGSEFNQLIADRKSRRVFFVKANEFNQEDPEQHLPQPLFKKLMSTFWQLLH